MTIIDGMLVSGWVAKVVFEGEEVMYGPFNTQEEADKWARLLTNGWVAPIYAPSHNRG